MVLRRTVCGEAVERSVGRRRTVDPSPFHTQEESPLPPRAMLTSSTSNRMLTPSTYVSPTVSHP